MRGLFDIDRKILNSNSKSVKFPTDNFDCEFETFRVVCEGVVFNSNLLIKSMKKHNLAEVIVDLFLCGGVEKVVNTLHGSFIVALQDVKLQKTYVFNDLLSKRPLYYCISQQKTLVNSSFFEIADEAKKENIRLSFDYDAVEKFLNTSQFWKDTTYFNEIRFIEYGKYIEIDINGDCRLGKVEYKPNYNIEELKSNKDLLLKKIYFFFSKACEEAVRKNDEGGYVPTFTLSGGMDSRCCFIETLKSIDDRKRVNSFSYGIDGCKDVEIANKLANQYDVHFKSYGIEQTFLLNKKEVILSNEGQMGYDGTTGLINVLHDINEKEVGVVFTGLGGGEIWGDLCKSNLSREENIWVRKQDVRMCLNFFYTCRKKFEVFSPFLDEDLFMLLLEFDYSDLNRRRLYVEFYNTFFENDLEVTILEGKPNKSNSIGIGKKIMEARRIIRKRFDLKNRWGMNPKYDLGECSIKSLVDEFKSGVEDIEDESLKSLLCHTFNGEDEYKKLNAMTAECVISLLFGKKVYCT